MKIVTRISPLLMNYHEIKGRLVACAFVVELTGELTVAGRQGGSVTAYFYVSEGEDRNFSVIVFKGYGIFDGYVNFLTVV